MTEFKAVLLAVITACTSGVAVAQTELEAALANGGEILNADQIAELLVGNSVTAMSGEKIFRFYYDPTNAVSGELTNGGWKGSGAFAITDMDQVCVSMAADNGRYRCLTVVRDGDLVQKFDVDGRKTFQLLKVEPSTGL
ncbi:MAG: hypothetical protein AAGF27_00035 [Pseudomonadota bacterium]